jgi:hypothetical protein
MFQLLQLSNGTWINIHQIVQISGLELHMSNQTTITVIQNDIINIFRLPVIVG